MSSLKGLFLQYRLSLYWELLFSNTLNKLTDGYYKVAPTALVSLFVEINSTIRPSAMRTLLLQTQVSEELKDLLNQSNLIIRVLWETIVIASKAFIPSQ